MRSTVLPRPPRRPLRRGTAFRTAAVALAMSAALAACSSGGSSSQGGSDAGEPVRGGTLVIAEGVTAPQLNPNPIGAPANATQQANSLMYETLLNRDADGNIIAGGLAESFQQQSPTVVVVKLRPGVKFHSGATMTADDVVYTFTRAKDPANGSSVTPIRLSAMASVAADDPNTVRFTLSRPDSGFMSTLTSEYFFIIEKKWGEEHNNDLNAFPNGTGPFKLETFVPNSQFRAVAFADYWDPQLPYLDAVEIKTMADVSTRTAALRTGDADLVEFPFDQGRLLSSLTGVTTIKGAPVTPAVMFMSCKIAPLDDIRVRQAFMHAIDLKAIAAGVVPGETQPLSYLVPPAFPKWGVPVGSEFPYPAQDIAKAKQLLAESGHPNGVTINLDLINSPAYDYAKRTVELIAQQVAPAGFTIKINPVDLATSLANLLGSKQMMSQTTIPIYDDPSGYWTSFAAGNVSGCTDQKIQDLIAQERAATDDATRKDLIKQIVVYAEEQAFTPVIYASSYRITAVKDNVHNYVPTVNARWGGARSTWKTQ